MTMIDQRIAKAEEALKAAHDRLKEAKALKQKQEARKRATLAKAERTADTRRKVLIGAMVLAQVENGDWPKDRLMAKLNSYLVRDQDRALFDLQPHPTEPAFIDDDKISEPPIRVALP